MVTYGWSTTHSMCTALVLLLMSHICFSILKWVVPILMCSFHSQLIDLDPKTHFVQFYPKVAAYFLSWGKNKYVTLGMRLLYKYIKKSKLVYQYQGNSWNIFHCTFQSIVNLKLKFWGYNEKSIGFHLTSKLILLRLSPEGWGCNRNIPL